MIHNLAVILAHNVIGKQPIAVIVTVGFVANHALGQQPGERFFQVKIAAALQGAGEEARIQQVQDSMFNPADILIHRQPIVGGLAGKSCLALGIGEARKIPGGFKESIKSVGLTLGVAAAAWTFDMFPAWMIG